MKLKYGPLVFLAPALVLITLVTIGPLLYNVYISLYEYSVIVKIKRFIGIGNYFAIFKDSRFLNSFQITLAFIGVVVPVELILGLGLALLFDKDIRGIDFLRTLMILPMIITPIAVGLTWRYIFEPTYGILGYFLGLIGVKPIKWLASTSSALWSCMIVDIWEWTPFIFIILFAGLRSLPREPFEAAKVDGASRWHMFKYITLPLLNRAILVAVIFRLIDAIRIYDIIVVLTHGGPALSTDVLSYYIYRTGFKHFNVGYAAALSLVFLAFGLIVILAYTRLSKLRLW